MASFTRNMAVVAVAIAMLLCLLAPSAYAASCKVPNCIRCSATSEYSCAQCESSYLPGYGQCAPPGTCGVTHCSKCASNSYTKCAVCQSPYVLSSTGLCARIVSSASALPQMMWTAAAVAGVGAAYVL